MSFWPTPTSWNAVLYTPKAAQLSSAMAHNSWSITRCGSFDAALRSVSGQIWSIRQVEGRDQWWTSIKPSSSLKVPRVWGFCKGSTTTQPQFQGCLAQQIWRNSCGPLLAIFCDESPHMSGWIITFRWDYHRLYVFLGKIWTLFDDRLITQWSIINRWTAILYNYCICCIYWWIFGWPRTCFLIFPLQTSPFREPSPFFDHQKKLIYHLRTQKKPKNPNDHNDHKWI